MRVEESAGNQGADGVMCGPHAGRLSPEAKRKYSYEHGKADEPDAGNPMNVATWAAHRLLLSPARVGQEHNLAKGCAQCIT